MGDDVEYWIYHERQDAMLCGQHALNNLVQECKFTAISLAEIAVRRLNIKQPGASDMRNIEGSHPLLTNFYSMNLIK
jgi:Josephin